MKVKFLEKAQSRSTCGYVFAAALHPRKQPCINKTGGSRAGRGTNSETYSTAIRTWIFVGGREHRRRATGYLLPFSARTVHPISMHINMKNAGGSRA